MVASTSLLELIGLVRLSVPLREANVIRALLRAIAFLRVFALLRAPPLSQPCSRAAPGGVDVPLMMQVVTPGCAVLAPRGCRCVADLGRPGVP